MSVFLQLQEIFRGSKTKDYGTEDDETKDDETKDDEAKDEDEEDDEDDEQPDTTDRPNLESEECAVQRRKQEAKGLKILTPNQVLIRLPISLAQLEAGNNSEKLKNEMIQLLHSLYRSKN